jgi:hypothetical protein
MTDRRAESVEQRYLDCHHFAGDSVHSVHHFGERMRRQWRGKTERRGKLIPFVDITKRALSDLFLLDVALIIRLVGCSFGVSSRARLLANRR